MDTILIGIIGIMLLAPIITMVWVWRELSMMAGDLEAILRPLDDAACHGAEPLWLIARESQARKAVNSGARGNGPIGAERPNLTLVQSSSGRTTSGS